VRLFIIFVATLVSAALGYAIYVYSDLGSASKIAKIDNLFPLNYSIIECDSSTNIGQMRVELSISGIKRFILGGNAQQLSLKAYSDNSVVGVVPNRGGAVTVADWIISAEIVLDETDAPLHDYWETETQWYDEFIVRNSTPFRVAIGGGIIPLKILLHGETTDCHKGLPPFAIWINRLDQPVFGLNFEFEPSGINKIIAYELETKDDNISLVKNLYKDSYAKILSVANPIAMLPSARPRDGFDQIVDPTTYNTMKNLLDSNSAVDLIDGDGLFDISLFDGVCSNTAGTVLHIGTNSPPSFSIAVNQLNSLQLIDFGSFGFVKRNGESTSPVEKGLGIGVHGDFFSFFRQVNEGIFPESVRRAVAHLHLFNHNPSMDPSDYYIFSPQKSERLFNQTVNEFVDYLSCE
jgi:hypothetical protein